MLKDLKQSRKCSFHNGEFILNIRILVIKACFVFRISPAPLNLFFIFNRGASNFVSIYFGRAISL